MAKNKEKEIERYKALQAYRLELLRATNAFEHAALRPPFILNGGALVVMIAFLGSIVGKCGAFSEKDMLFYALGSWVTGAFLSAAAVWLGYESQFSFLKAKAREINAEHAEDANNRNEAAEQRCEQKIEGERGKHRRAWAKALAGFSFLLFLAGVTVATVALINSIP